ncbi:MAG: hypothetical protein E7042_01825 [Lentisphaerae bacterium]|nr:hypothetical protein [Lentisphaerota bacterium]
MFIKKEKYKMSCGKYRLWTLFNIPIVGYWYCENGTDKTKHWVFPLFRKMTFENRRVMYLKININDFYAFDCFQHWVDTAHKMNAIIVIVCDSETVAENIKKRITFHNIEFIWLKSRTSRLSDLVKITSDPSWSRAACAKLTCFDHAREHNISNFWKIDADDTKLCCDASQVANILTNAENVAEEQSINAFSLDMHFSFFHSKHWSFGVCYINRMDNLFDCIKKHGNAWTDYYSSFFNGHYNLDWFFSFLMEQGTFNIKTFYVDELYFIHYKEYYGRNLYFWKDQKCTHPLLKAVDSEYAETAVSTDAIAITTPTPLESKKFVKENIFRTSCMNENLNKIINHKRV